MNLETAIVLLVVALAVVWSVRIFARSWSGKSQCGCGSSRCPAAKEAADRILRSIDANASEHIADGNERDPKVRHATQ